MDGVEGKDKTEDILKLVKFRIEIKPIDFYSVIMSETKEIKQFLQLKQKPIMKKKLAMLAAVCALSISAIAQTPGELGCQNKDKECIRKECTGLAVCDRQCQFADSPAFSGINLTDAQKQQLNALNPKADKAKLKEDKKQSEKALRDGFRKKAMEARKDNLAKIKSILTPEQYIQFLENNYLKANIHKGKRDFRRGDCKKKDFKYVDNKINKDKKRMNKDKKDKDNKDRK